MQNSNKPALLVSVHIHQWGNRKSDKSATAMATVGHGASEDAGNFTKKLLPHAVEMRRISTLHGQIRDFVNMETLPWMADGTRILASQNYLDFVSKFRAKKSEFESAVADFILAYPQLIADAQAKLGGLYNAADYPSPERLASKFKCEMDLMPLPDVTDFRLEISDAERRKFESKIRETQAKAMLDCWSRLHTVVKSAAERLADPKGVFRESLISNITEICQLLPKLNFTNDPMLEAERVKIEQLASGLAPEMLRSNASERKSAADQLAQIQSKMAAIMGGNPPPSAEDQASARLVALRLGGATIEGDGPTRLDLGVIIKTGSN